MEMSHEINELVGALAKAQGAIEGAKRGSDNPFFHSKYAELSEVWDVIREPLSRNGLAVIQTMSSGAGEFKTVNKPIKDRQGNITGQKEVPLTPITICSLLAHSSGQWVKDSVTVWAEVDSQSLGSTTTYMRRYGLMALVGVAPEDDDSEAAMGRPSQKPPATASAPNGEHWCKEHNTQFFKKGAMKSFAHAVKNPDGSGLLRDGKAVWCHEHTDNKPPVPPAPTSGPIDSAQGKPTEPTMATLGDLAAWAWKQGVNQAQMLNLLDAKVLSDIKDIPAAKDHLTEWIKTRDSQKQAVEEK